MLSDRPAHSSPETSRETTGPVPGGGRALDFFSQGLRQQVLVEGEIGHEPFGPDVLLFHLPQSAEFAHAEMGVLLLSGIKCWLGDAELSAWRRV